MKKIFLFQIISAFTFFQPVHAGNFYIDPSAVGSKQKGTLQDPWTEIAPLNEQMTKLTAGDTVFFKKGEMFTEVVRIRCSGKPGAPVVFMPYGNARSNPLFLFKMQENEYHNMFEIRHSKYIDIQGLHVTDDKLRSLDEAATARIRIAFNIDSSDYCRIRDCRVSYAGIGANIIGSHNEIENCRFENMRMVWNTEGGDDDYGANGVVIAGPDNLVSGCIFKNCWGKSYDYEFDGGAIDLYGSESDNTRIIRNIAVYCNGFMEIGSGEGGDCLNTVVEGNLIVNCGDLLYISTGGKFALNVSGLHFSGNKLIQTTDMLTKPRNLVSMTKAISGGQIMDFTGNIFWVSTGTGFLRPSVFQKGQIGHQSNIFYLSGGKLNMEPAETDQVYDATRGEWPARPLNEILRINASLYPFKYLLPYWYLFI